MSSSSEDVTKTIELDEEIEGDQIGSRDYRFSCIGEPVPIKPEFQFDPDSPPAQPLAVSQTFRLLFVAHSHGFCVVRTKEVMAAAEEIKAKGSSRSIQELSIVDVSIGKVSILALSPDDSMLAASVGHQLHFFAVSSLLHKEQEPSFSVSIDDSSCIIDMRWTRRAEKAYVVLSSHGKLYQGSDQGPLREVMDNVDAVEWSVKGDFVAVARKNVLSVFSPQFKEKLSLLLSFKSVIGDSEDNSVIKVNSIRWTRSDCIVIGCLQSNGDAEEENYLVQVITSKEGKITDASSKPIVISFNDVFLDYWGDAVPFASGPHLFLSYLDHQQLAFVVNRKNQSQHVILLGWGQNDKMNEAAAIEIASDAWNAHIESQANGDDNLVLGLSIDKVSQNEEVRLVLGEKETEVSPCCVLLCITIDGKLSLFHFASAGGSSVLPEGSGVSHEEEDAPHTVLSESSEISSRVGEKSGKQALQISESHELSRNQIFNREEVKVATHIDQSSALFMNKSQGTTENQEQNPLRYSQTIIGDGQQKFLLSKLREDRNIQQTSYTGQQVANLEPSSLQTSRFLDSEPAGQDVFKKDNPAISETKSSSGFFSLKDFNDVSSQATSKNMLGCSTEFPGMMATAGSQSTPPLSWSTTAANSSKIFGEKSLFFPSSAVQKSEISDRSALKFAGGPLQDVNSSKPSSEESLLLLSSAVRKSEMSNRSAFNFSGGPRQYPSHSKEAVSPSLSVNSSGERAPTGTGNIQLLAAFRGSQSPLMENLASGKSFKSHQKMENYAAPSSEGVQNSEPNSSKQYCNIEEMAKKLDNLLEGIEGKGGFKDASIASQESLVVALEEGIWALSHRCRVWQGTMDEQLREIQQLLDKTIQDMDAKNLAFEIERKRREAKEAKRSERQARKDASKSKKSKHVEESTSGTRQTRDRRLIDEPELKSLDAGRTPPTKDGVPEPPQTTVEQVDLTESSVRETEVVQEATRAPHQVGPRSSWSSLPLRSPHGIKREGVVITDIRGLDRIQMRVEVSYNAEEGAKCLQGAIEHLGKLAEFYEDLDRRYGELEVRNQQMVEAHEAALASLRADFEGKLKMAVTEAGTEKTLRLAAEVEREAAKKELHDLQARLPYACEQAVKEFQASKEYKKIFEEGYVLARENSIVEAQSSLAR